jgi:hypothetical protein
VPPTTTERSKHAVATFLILGAVAIAAVVSYAVFTSTTGASDAVAAVPAADATAIATVTREPFIVFRHAGLGNAYGRIGLSTVAAQGTPRFTTTLTCDRVHFAAGRGVCLVANRGIRTTYEAVMFDDTFTAGTSIPLPGVPSRVRISPDGRRAGMTVFVSGDSYASGNFSTRTFIIETGTGQVLGQLEEFAVTRDGQSFAAPDFNFWGVTFLDASRFYATLGTAGKIYLVEGDVDGKRMKTLREGVECPSLSPDQTRLVFKKRELDGIRLRWRLAVLDLATGKETLIGETRDVDDQSEWLDDRHVMYALRSETRAASTDLWVAPADGSGAPQLFLPDGWSPAVVRP